MFMRIDLQGHGNTAGVRGLIDVVAAVDDHLAARAAMPKKLPTFLMGHSLGGLITAGSVVRDQANIEAAIISSSAMQTPSNLGLRALTKVLARIAQLLQSRFQDQASSLGQETRRY